MKIRLFLILAAVIASQQVLATCDPSFIGVAPSNSPEITSFVPCESCRSVQDFPADFLASASNYIFHTSQGASALGTYVGSGGMTSLRFPVCSEDHGQCATATVTVAFNYANVPIAGEVIPIPTGIRNHTIQITDSGGTDTSQTSTTADPNPHRQIPTNSSEDTIPDGECRQNNGQDRGGNDDGGGDDGSDNDNDNNTGGGPGGGAENGSGGGAGTGAGGAHSSTGGGGGSSGGAGACHTTMTDNEIILTCRRA